jgi:2-polyprenyl-3-methyl-5-hydroxy-6-metoxy-1,4-benzoquinol methylase
VEDFLVHHTPNLYTDRACVSLASLKEQIQTLFDILNGEHPACTLFKTEPRFWHFWWQKDYFEIPCKELLQMVPGDAKSILSIGCGWGVAESRLRERGTEVTALPLDSVVGAVAARRGIDVVHGSWDECRKILRGRTFDCVVMSNLLHLLPNPGRLVEQCARFVRDGGTLVLAGPNFDRIPWRMKRAFGAGEFRKLRSFAESGISVCSPKTLARPIRNAGLRMAAVQWLNHTVGSGPLRGRQISLGRLTARDWVLQARREQ